MMISPDLPITERQNCIVCGNREGNLLHAAREMLFGTRESFTYLECANCGAWTLLNVPQDLAPYYPAEYYAFKRPKVRLSQRVKHAAGRPVLNVYLKSRNRLLKELLRSMRRLPESIHVLSRLGIDAHAPILDVGTGQGKYLLKLHRLGFTNLLGVDKFIRQEIDYGNGVRVLNCELSELGRAFRVVMSHHSFEHVPDPLTFLHDLAAATEPRGAIVIRTPNADSYACRTYGVHWFALDPPRHLVVHTPRSLERLADNCGLTIESVTYDSTPGTILASMQYQNDIPYNAPSSFAIDRQNSTLSKSDFEIAEKMTRKLNAECDGDCMCVTLRKK